jgi:hypothetical protein
MSLAFLAAGGRDKALKLIVPLRRSVLATVMIAVGMSLHFVCVAAEPKPPAPSASAQSGLPKDPVRAAMFQSLRAVWQRQQSDIASAKIKLRLLHASVSEGTLPPGIPRARLRDFLRGTDLAASQDNMQELIAFCLIDLKSVTRSRMEHELLIAANRRRETAGKTLTVADGAQNIYSRIGIVRPKEVRQIDLFPLGQGVEPLNLNDLRVVLWPKMATCVLDGSIKANAVSEHQEQISLTLEADNKAASLEYVVDRSSGACLERIKRDGKKNVLSEVVQGGCTPDEKGVLFPKYNLHLFYDHERLVKLVLFYVLSAEFNQPVPDDAFKVSADEGDMILDHRRDARPIPRRVSAPVEDVAKQDTKPRR